MKITPAQRKFSLAMLRAAVYRAVKQGYPCNNQQILWALVVKASHKPKGKR